MEHLQDIWTFMKAAPWTFAVGGLILVIAVAGVIYGVVKHYDRGFMKKDGKVLHWAKTNIPLVFAHTSRVTTFQLAGFQRVISEINEFCGKDIISRTIRKWYDVEATDETIGDLLDGISSETTIVNVLIDIDPTLPAHVGGQTKLNWDKRTGELLAAYIKVPSEDRGDHTYVVIAHEVGHSLGLDHDDKRASIMHESLASRKQDFTETDKKRLRGRYA